MAATLLLPNRNPAHWALTTSLLSSPIPDFAHLTSILIQLGENIGSSLEYEEFDSLRVSVEWMSANVPGFDLYGCVLPYVQRCALRLPEVFPEGKLPLLAARREAVVTLTREQCSVLLSNAFFLNLPCPDQRSYGNINHARLYRDGGVLAVERLKCWLRYFQTISTPGFNFHGIVTFQRIVVSNETKRKWKDSAVKIECEVEISHEKRIEDCGEAGAHVDFANMRLSIHKLIPSCTQEEIMFSIRPDALLSMVITETLADNEAVVMTGTPTYSNYTGYDRTFKFSNPEIPVPPPPPYTDIIAIDAMVCFNRRMQFDSEGLERDLTKAYAGFLRNYTPEGENGAGIYHPSRLISTGNWGCGVFGGDPHLKFVQQMMVASVTGRDLFYSTFGNRNLCAELTKIAEMIKKTKPSVGEMFRLVEEYENAGARGSLLGFLERKMAPANNTSR